MPKPLRLTLQFPVQICDLGVMPYDRAHRTQLDYHQQVLKGVMPPTLLFVEHPRTITFGKRAGDHANLRISEAELRARGFTLCDVERGGDVTYHGPGQLVGYPIVPIGRRVREYLLRLEAALVQALASFGIQGQAREDRAGVWVGDEKVCAVGIAVQQGVSFHGFALNVCTQLTDFEVIVPCGLAAYGVTSMTKLLGHPVTLDAVKPVVAKAVQTEFQQIFTA